MNLNQAKKNKMQFILKIKRSSKTFYQSKISSLRDINMLTENIKEIFLSFLVMLK